MKALFSYSEHLLFLLKYWFLSKKILSICHSPSEIYIWIKLIDKKNSSSLVHRLVLIFCRFNSTFCVLAWAFSLFFLTIWPEVFRIYDKIRYLVSKPITQEKIFKAIFWRESARMHLHFCQLFPHSQKIIFPLITI
jgi:hypothetical protein